MSGSSTVGTTTMCFGKYPSTCPIRRCSNNICVFPSPWCRIPGAATSPTRVTTKSMSKRSYRKSASIPNSYIRRANIAPESMPRACGAPSKCASISRLFSTIIATKITRSRKNGGLSQCSARTATATRRRSTGGTENGASLTTATPADIGRRGISARSKGLNSFGESTGRCAGHMKR